MVDVSARARDDQFWLADRLHGRSELCEAQREVPTTYKENAGWQVAQPQDAVLRGKWWEMFSDPQLNAFEEQVEVSNQNVAVAEAQFRQARAFVQQARAAYFPTVTVGVGVHNSSLSTTIARSAGSRFSSMLYSLPVEMLPGK